jgi:hypothetical protein
MYVYLFATMHSQAVGDNDPKPLRVNGGRSEEDLRGVGNLDAAKLVSTVCIPSVGLRPIDAKTKGGDSGGAPDSKTAPKLGCLRPGVRGQVGVPVGPVLRGFWSNRPKTFSGTSGVQITTGKAQWFLGAVLGEHPLGQKGD